VVFRDLCKQFADMGFISVGDERFLSIHIIHSFSELDDVQWFGRYLLEIRSAIGDTIFRGRCPLVMRYNPVCC